MHRANTGAGVPLNIAATTYEIPDLHVTLLVSFFQNR
jgi:hypothetical protein